MFAFNPYTPHRFHSSLKERFLFAGIVMTIMYITISEIPCNTRKYMPSISSVSGRQPTIKVADHVDMHNDIFPPREVMTFPINYLCSSLCVRQGTLVYVAALVWRLSTSDLAILWNVILTDMIAIVSLE